MAVVTGGALANACFEVTVAGAAETFDGPATGELVASGAVDGGAAKDGATDGFDVLAGSFADASRVNISRRCII